MTSPEPRGPARNLYAAARRLRAALLRLDLEAAALAGDDCRHWLERLGSCPPQEAEDRRWALAAERVLARCQGLVRKAMDDTADEISLMNRRMVGAARYAEPIFIDF